MEKLHIIMVGMIGGQQLLISLWLYVEVSLL